MLKPFSRFAPSRFALCRIALAAALAWAAFPAAAQGQKSVPPSELSEPTLYEFLLGEIALQRGDHALAAKTYLDLARRIRDPRIARRAMRGSRVRLASSR